MENDDSMGQWKGGKMHGDGTYRSADGTMKYGHWSRGKLKKENVVTYFATAELTSREIRSSRHDARVLVALVDLLH